MFVLLETAMLELFLNFNFYLPILATPGQDEAETVRFISASNYLHSFEMLIIFVFSVTIL